MSEEAVETVDILLIEDDQFKQEQIERAIMRVEPNSRITLARSVQQAVRALRVCGYHRIVLDMALPSHEGRAGGAQPTSQPTGGIEVLLELSYDGRGDPVVIVTQYPDIEFEGRTHPLGKARQALTAAMAARIIDVIYFSAQDDSWHERFAKALA